MAGKELLKQEALPAIYFKSLFFLSFFFLSLRGKKKFKPPFLLFSMLF